MANAAHIEHKFPVRRNRKSLLEEFVRRHTSLASISELSESWNYCTGSVSSSIRALYYAAVGYKRERIGGAREMMSRDNSHNVSTSGNSCFPQYSGILTSRASTSSVVLLRKYTFSLKIYV